MKHVCWLSGPLHIEERLNEGPRLQLKHIDENEAQQNKRNTRERHHDIYKPNARRIQVHCSRYLYIIIYRAWYKISRTTLKKREREKNVLFSVLLFFPLLTDYYLTSTSPLGWAILSLLLPVMSGHTTPCRCPALAFSAAIHFAMKCSTPCFSVMCN